MSERLPALTPKQLIRVMEQLGWLRHRTTSSHQMTIHPDPRRIVPVPVHNRALKTGTLLGILRAAGISRDELRERL